MPATIVYGLWSIVLFELIPIIIIFQDRAVWIDRAFLLPTAVAEDTGKERMDAKLVVMTEGQFMRNGVFEVALDVEVRFLAGDDASQRPDFDQHALEFEHALSTKDSLAVPGEYLVQLTDRELMSQFGQTALARDFGCWVDQFERHEDLADNELLHFADAVDDFVFADREELRIRTRC